MNYTDLEKRKMVSAFRKAAAVLARTNPAAPADIVFICLALAATEGDANTVEICVNLIETRLEGHKSLRAWLEHRAGVAPEELTFEAVQQHRFNWLQQLIAEFTVDDSQEPS